MRRPLVSLIAASLFTLSTAHAQEALSQARAKFKPTFRVKQISGEPFAPSPKEIFELVYYESNVGKLGAYVTPKPKDGKKHPAIIWITGNDCNTIGDVWSSMDTEIDQTAKAYRNAGIVMMFPSLRGGNTNPGFKEYFYGE